jgi:hypothetical protein
MKLRANWMLLSAFYYTYDLLNMFRAPLCPSSGAHDYIPLFIWLCGYASGYCRHPSHIDSQLTPYHHQDPRRRRSMWWTVVYNHELLMMGIEMPETCWANHECNKKHWATSSWFFISLTITTMHRHIIFFIDIRV